MDSLFTQSRKSALKEGRFFPSSSCFRVSDSSIPARVHAEALWETKVQRDTQQKGSWYSSVDQPSEKVLRSLDSQVERWRRMLGCERSMVAYETPINNPRVPRSRMSNTEAQDTGNPNSVSLPVYLSLNQSKVEEKHLAFDESLQREKQKVEQLQHNLAQVLQAYQAAIQRAEWAEGVVLQRASPVNSQPRTEDAKDDGLESSASVVVRATLPTTDSSSKNITVASTTKSTDKSPSPVAVLPSSSSTEDVVAHGSVESVGSKPDASSLHQLPSWISKVESTQQSSSSVRSRSIVVVRKKKPPNLD